MAVAATGDELRVFGAQYWGPRFPRYFCIFNNMELVRFEGMTLPLY
jgi:hypothetical protein